MANKFVKNRNLLWNRFFLQVVLISILVGISFQIKSLAAGVQCKEVFSDMSAQNHSVLVSEFNLQDSRYKDELKEANMLPIGSAFITSSGHLKELGIEQIVHAASGSMTRVGFGFDPTLTSISDSLSSSLRLAIRNKLKSIAVPFIGGGIFASRIGISNTEIAAVLLRIAASVESHTNIQVKFVLFGKNDFNLFESIAETLQISNIEIIEGSIVNFQVHKCQAIINAANTEGIFGGGLSGVIGKATDDISGINEKANSAIRNYWNLF